MGSILGNFQLRIDDFYRDYDESIPCPIPAPRAFHEQASVVYPLHVFYADHTRCTFFMLIIAVFTPYFGHIALLYMTCYLLSPLVTWRIHPEVAVKETRIKTAEAH
jgi:hypothetical protein